MHKKEESTVNYYFKDEIKIDLLKYIIYVCEVIICTNLVELRFSYTF